MTTPLEFLAVYLADLATDLSNRMLEQDPDLRSRLEALRDTSIEWRLTFPAASWHMHFSGTGDAGEGITLRPGPAKHPTTIVTGTAYDLLAGLGGNAPDNLRVDGDSMLLTQFIEAVKHIRPDLTDVFYRLPGSAEARGGLEFTRNLGDAIALGISGLHSAAQGVLHQVKGASAANFVHDNDLDPMLDRLQRLRLRVDRLAARIALREASL